MYAYLHSVLVCVQPIARLRVDARSQCSVCQQWRVFHVLLLAICPLLGPTQQQHQGTHGPNRDQLQTDHQAHKIAYDGTNECSVVSHGDTVSCRSQVAAVAPHQVYPYHSSRTRLCVAHGGSSSTTTTNIPTSVGAQSPEMPYRTVTLNRDCPNFTLERNYTVVLVARLCI
jgi:hypothetical protein